MMSEERPVADHSKSQLDIAEQLSVIVVNLAESVALFGGIGLLVFDALSHMALAAVALLLVWMEAQ